MSEFWWQHSGLEWKQWSNYSLRRVLELLFILSVVSDSLWPHGLQHVRFPCPSLSPRVCSNSCPLSQWCHPTISSSVVFSSCPRSFPASESFPMSQFFASGDQNIGVLHAHIYVCLSSQGYGFSCGHVWMWELDYKAECWTIYAFELWCWRGLLRVLWTARRSNQSILKEISPEYLLEGLMLKLKLQLWPPDAKNRLTGKDPDAGKDWRRKEKGTAEDEMVGWHHWLNGHEFE